MMVVWSILNVINFVGVEDWCVIGKVCGYIKFCFFSCFEVDCIFKCVVEKKIVVKVDFIEGD